MTNSDHRLIRFKIQIDRPTVKYVMDDRTTNWEKFQAETEEAARQGLDKANSGL